MLAAVVLALGHDAGRDVRDAHGGVGLVDVLSARAARAVGVDAQVGRVDLHGHGLVGLGQHGDRAGAGVDAALRLGGGHALHAMAARLEAQVAENVVADDAHHHFLVAAEFALALAHDLAAPAGALAIARVHAQQVAREEGRFVAARARADFEKGVARVVRVFGQQQALQLFLELHQLGLGAGDFLACHLGHVGVVEHLLGAGDVGLALPVALIAAGDLGDFGMLARDGAVLRHVAHDVFAREQEVELAQALGVAFELVAQKGFHGGRGSKKWEEAAMQRQAQ